MAVVIIVLFLDTAEERRRRRGGRRVRNILDRPPGLQTPDFIHLLHLD